MEPILQKEARLLEAATSEFHEKGFHGARMQEIARRAGLNQSLLHYYYRTKGRLFEAVFQAATGQVMVPVLEILGGDYPLREKVERFTHTYIDLILAHPHVPGFVMEELRRNPGRLRHFVGERSAGLYTRLERQIVAAVDAGDIRPIEPEQFLVHLLALCVFPFVARPMVQTLTGMDDARYREFLLHRKQTVVRFFFDALAP